MHIIHDETVAVMDTARALVPIDPQTEDMRLLRCLPYQPVPVAYLPLFQIEVLWLCVERGMAVLCDDETRYALTEAGRQIHRLIYAGVEVAHGR